MSRRRSSIKRAIERRAWAGDPQRTALALAMELRREATGYRQQCEARGWHAAAVTLPPLVRLGEIMGLCVDCGLPLTDLGD